MIPNPSLDCSYVVLNFLAKFEPRCSYKIVLIRKASICVYNRIILVVSKAIVRVCGMIAINCKIFHVSDTE